MRGFIRSTVPTVLIDVDPTTGKTFWELQGEKYTQKRIDTAHRHTFQWPSVSGKRLNQHLLPHLLELTDGHCAYCDTYPLGRSDETIDHFLPKSVSTFYAFVCQWENLYIACADCQNAKKEQHDSRLLRPDEVNYNFSRYFIYDFITDKIECNPAATPIDQDRAESTISIFDLNHKAHCINRRRARQLFTADPTPILSDYNYRFIFEMIL